jgi:hypothetical protein
MKIFSILAIILLTSCAVLQKDKEEIKKISHDAVDEEIESLDK